MITDRPYSKAMTIEQSIAELLRCSGTQFDSEVVLLFIEKVLSDENRITLEEGHVSNNV
jgi:HD-GYP domain-containing protein (c-di-GMP phosphodiesterase class II)